MLSKEAGLLQGARVGSVSDGRLLNTSKIVQGFVFSLVLGILYFAQVGREVAVAGIAAQQRVALFCRQNHKTSTILLINTFPKLKMNFYETQ